jgi:hypothetical protein
MTQRRRRTHWAAQIWFEAVNQHCGELMVIFDYEKLRGEFVNCVRAAEGQQKGRS